MRRRSRFLLTFAGLGLLLAGFVGFVVGPMISAGIPRSDRVRFPLGDPAAVDTDAAGRIYVVDDFYARVQRFSPSGEFDRGWHVDGVGPFNLRVELDSTVAVAVAKARMVLVYSADGSFLARRPLEAPFEQFAGQKIGLYSVRGPLTLRPGVVRVSDGKRVISDSLKLTLVRGPFTSWLTWSAGILLLMASQRKCRDGRRFVRRRW